MWAIIRSVAHSSASTYLPTSLPRFFVIARLAESVKLRQEELEKQKILKQSRERNETAEFLLRQMQMPKNNAKKRFSVVDLDTCGASSAQRFEGEDNDYEARKKLQQEQVRVLLFNHVSIFFTCSIHRSQ